MKKSVPDGGIHSVVCEGITLELFVSGSGQVNGVKFSPAFVGGSWSGWQSTRGCSTKV